ncbi:50S ribosomal protein L31 [Spiroplasma endosymbiont of Aspidapion aeneum]|uniref:50S ribosomal protein L31 n=1 Tax=Spiroplasma endosymbiont of Aspidapion aeneum TaxID=3066276 RepID=UPI00313BE9D1
MPRKDIHPKIFDAKFICTVCASEFSALSTKSDELRVDTCAKCHPFYTGKQNFSNTEGRVEKFKEKYAKQAAIVAKQKELSEIKKAENKKNEKPKKEKSQIIL